MSEISENIKYLQNKKIAFIIKQDFTKLRNNRTFLPLRGIKKDKFFGVFNFRTDGFTVISGNFFRSIVSLCMIK